MERKGGDGVRLCWCEEAVSWMRWGEMVVASVMGGIYLDPIYSRTSCPIYRGKKDAHLYMTLYIRSLAWYHI